MTQDEFNQKWSSLLSGERTPTSIMADAVTEQPSEQEPIQLGNGRTLEDFRRDAYARAFRKEQ